MPEELKVGVEFKMVGGQLVAQQIGGVDQKLGELKQKTNKLGDAFKGLIPIISAVAIVKFFTDSIKAAEEENEALRILRGELEATGISFASVEKEVKAFADRIQATTRFSDTETYKVLGNLTRRLGDLGQAYAGVSLATDIASATGKGLTEMSDLLAMALTRPERGAMMLRREFGAIVGTGKDVGEMMKKLQDHFGGAAQKEESLTKQTAQLKNAWSDFMEDIGKRMSPFVSGLLQGLSIILKGFQQTINTIGDMWATQFAVIIDGAKMVWNAITFQWGKIPANWKDMTGTIKTIWQNHIDELIKLWGMEVKEFEKGQKGKLKVHKDTSEEKAKAEEKLKEIREKFDLDYLESVKGKYTKELKLLDDRIEGYRKAGFDEVKITEIMNAEIVRIGNEAKDESYKLAQDHLERLKALAEEEIAIRKQVAQASVSFAVSSAEAIGLALGESARGSQDAWIRAFDTIVDAAFNSLSSIIDIYIAQATAEAIINPLAWGKVIGLAALKGGLAALKGAIRYTPTPTPTPTYTTPAPGTPPTITKPGEYGTPLQAGGIVEKTGLAVVHEGEKVIPAGKSGEINISISISMLDPSQISDITLRQWADKIARQIKKIDRIGGI